MLVENWETERYLDHDDEAVSEQDAATAALATDEPLVPEPTTDDPPVATESITPLRTLSEAPLDETNLDVDPELLEALGTFQEETTEWGEPIVEHIAMRLKPLLVNGFKKDEKEALIKKYPIPKNVSLAKAPTLNAEVSAMLSEPSRNRDKRLHTKQNQLGAVLSAVTKAMSQLLCKDPKITDILGMLSDASKLLADSHFLETDTRRSLITPLIDKELIDPFKDRKRDDFLFGDNLGELVKNSRGIKKTGQLIQASTSSNLNHKWPSSRGRSQKNYANRGGGQQRPYRRTAPHGPPAAPPRRQPQAPYAPQRRRPPPVSTVNAPRTAPTPNDRTNTGT